MNTSTINPTPQYSKVDTPVIQFDGFTITVFLSLITVGTIFVKIITRFNEIDLGMKELKEDFKHYLNTEGNEKILQQFKGLEHQLNAHDKLFAIHLQDFQNRKETVQFLLGQLDEKIAHKGERWSGELKELEKEVKELQGFLQKYQNFTVREDKGGKN